MMRATRSGIFLSALIWAPILVLAAACSKPATTIQPGGMMNILGPIPALVPNPLPDDWIIEGKPAPGQLTVVERDGVPALKVVNGRQSFVAAKPARASLLATPYLSWAWNMEPQNRGTHPVRLAIGFDGGNPDNRAWRSGFGKPGARLPLHDRAIVIVWAESALQLGTITKPKPTGRGQAAARYTARGGRENAGSWVFKTVDLSDIYRRAWPGDDAGNVQITFIGIAAASGKTPSAAYISGLRLSR
jgi:hypothetical protein